MLKNECNIIIIIILINAIINTTTSSSRTISFGIFKVFGFSTYNLRAKVLSHV